MADRCMGHPLGFAPRLSVLAVTALFGAAWFPVSCGGRGPLLGAGDDGAGGHGSQGGHIDKNGDGGEGPTSGHCRSGDLLCQGVCTAVRFDPENCGACDVACADGELCSNGECRVGCGPGTEQCGERCVDTALDFENCGECGHACSAGQSCSGGICGESCGGGLNACDGSCVDLELDPENCGACGAECEVGEFCSVGACGSACVGGTHAVRRTLRRRRERSRALRQLLHGVRRRRGLLRGQVRLRLASAAATRCGDMCVDTAVDSQNCGA